MWPPAADAAHAGDDLLVVDDLEVEQPQRARVVQAVDEVLDVGRGVLLAHQARDRVLELAAVDDDGRPVHRELVVVAGVVDVQMGVQDVADVLHLEAVLGELLLHALLVAPPAGHAEVAHDRRIAEARVDDDRGLAAGDEEAERRHLLRLSGLERQHEEARVELDVAQVEDLHFETHSLLLGGWMTFGVDYPPPTARPPSHVRMRCHQANTRAHQQQPRSRAAWTASAREVASSLRKRLRAWVFAVASLMPRRGAICLKRRPSSRLWSSSSLTPGERDALAPAARRRASSGASAGPEPLELAGEVAHRPVRRGRRERQRAHDAALRAQRHRAAAVKAGEQDDAVQRAVEGVGGVEVLVVEGAPLGHLGEVRARAQRQLGARREQLGAARPP